MSIQSVYSQNAASGNGVNAAAFADSYQAVAGTNGASTMSYDFGNQASQAMGFPSKNFNPGQLIMGLIQVIVSLLSQLVGFMSGNKSPQPGFGDGGMHLMTAQPMVNAESAPQSAEVEGTEPKRANGWGKLITTAVDFASSYFGGGKSETSKKDSGFDWGGALKTVAGWFGY